ncbi:uncharacterized protein LOC122260534 isoform X2 [Penaeus japonicus]|uniref:uncharacterized protein LOC122260534 isoform X2 n=1 Tax=Penaeus japonicus TaxID=27405 RepID=UPI001C712C45|nr:uncharacterized protein LOC122260534 isoform X2 [Penaeus japonicus]
MATSITPDERKCFIMTSTERASEDILKEYLQPIVNVKPPAKITLEEFIEISDNFAIPFPVQTARAKVLLKNGYEKEALEKYINSAYPLVHERQLPLLAAFLHYKKTHGRKREKELYSSLDLLGLVSRLLRKRPVVFFKSSDSYLLRDGSEGCEGFEDIGHSHESPRLPIQEYMTYDEIKLSALMCVSSWSPFINNGSRHNRGVLGQAGDHEAEGVIVGMVGTRFEREGVMEWQDCLVTPEQNTKERGYGDDAPQKRWLVREWGKLWDAGPLPTWKQVQQDAEGNFVHLTSHMMLNAKVYKARIRLSAEVLLGEASSRAAAAGKRAYVHVVGLGLGVWQVSAQQEQLFVDAWGSALASADTTHIGHVDFSWIKAKTCHGAGDGEEFPGTKVVLHFSQRALHDPVPADTLLVDSFAWDGNSLPGNEYWKGMLSASGDPAAACSSGVAELHNALINPLVCAENLHVVAGGRVEHIAQYAARLTGGRDTS